MADAIVSAVLQQLVTILDRQVKQTVRLVVGVDQEVEKMRSTFRTIQAALVDAENRQLKDDFVKDWLDKLKHISYDIDDVFDEWNTALLKSKIDRDRGHKTPSTPTLLSKVRSCVPSLCSCFGELALRHDIAISIKELNEKLQAIAKEKDDFAFVLDLPKNSNDLETERLRTTCFFDESEIRGRDQDKHNLLRLLLSENSPEERGIPIISILGMGGIGKTTLAQMVYNHPELSAYFQKKIWVCVSYPFDEMRIAKAILESLTGSASDLNELNSVLDKIHESIVGKSYLLVLDDVWDEEGKKWQSLKNCLNCDPQGSRILVTTRKENVATVMGCTKLIHLGKLSQEDCWSLFSQIALSGRNNVERESLEDIGKEIAHKCQGLPLAAKTLGGLLRFKRSREQWQRILDSSMWKLDAVERGVFSPLLLSYYNLSSPLRQCFSYCAIFPKDHLIKKDLLIKLWMAQGFLGKRQGEEMEIVGEEYFNNLATRSFFQEFEKDEDDDSVIIGCKMHDIVHDFAQLLRKTECCVVASNGIEVRGADFYPENFRHLRLILGQSQMGIPIPLKKLRSLLVESNFDAKFTLEASLSKLFDQSTCLRMLKLQEDSINKLPQEIGKLIHLRYLGLAGSRFLYELPEALCDLCNLQTLNIRECYHLQRLPRGMERLINLRHLQNRLTNSLLMPKAIQRLTCLQTLEQFRVMKKGGGIESETLFSLEDLGKLIHLRGHLEIRGLGNVGEVSKVREAPLSTNAAGLCSLTLSFWGGYDKEQQARIEDDASVLQALQPPRHLQILKILYCESPAFPNWITSLTLLKSVELRECPNWESLPPMGMLPWLQSLTISTMQNVKKVGEEFLGVETSSSSSVNHYIAFPNLKKLLFSGMGGWEEWDYEKVLRSRGGDDSSSSSSSSSNITIMPKLQQLIIGECPVLKMLPSHLLQSTALQQLVIRGKDIPLERFNKKTGDDCSSISHIRVDRPESFLLGDAEDKGVADDGLIYILWNRERLQKC